MFRIDDPTAAASLPAPEAAGTEAYWTEGNPGTGVPATLMRASFFNMVQEELRAIVIAAGLTPSKTNYSQILTALQTIWGPGRAGHVYGGNDWIPLGGGMIFQWAQVTSSASADATWTFPVAFPANVFGAFGTYTHGAGSGSVVVSSGIPALSGIGFGAYNSTTAARVAAVCSLFSIGK
jgi:hypothetical protein